MTYSYVLAIYVASIFFHLGASFIPHRHNSLLQASRWGAITLMSLGLLSGLGTLGYLWVTLGHPPFRTLGQSLLVLSTTTTLIWLLAFRNIKYVGVAASVFIAIALAYGVSRADLDARELPPALQSAWFIPHVVVYFVAYSLLFFSLVFSILYLLSAKRSPENPSHELARWMDHSVRLGFALLSIGLILGAFWAQVAWGNWWTWDPKENFALVSWFVYAAWLHVRLMPGVKPPLLAALSVVGFIIVLFTYVGVNYLASNAESLHAYAN